MMGRLAVPTPGSTTTRCTVPLGKYEYAWEMVKAPSSTSNACTAWLMSTISASGTMLRMTPFMVPTK